MSSPTEDRPLDERARAMLFCAIEQATDTDYQGHEVLVVRDSDEVDAVLDAIAPTVAVLLTEARTERTAEIAGRLRELDQTGHTRSAADWIEWVWKPAEDRPAARASSPTVAVLVAEARAAGRLDGLHAAHDFLTSFDEQDPMDVFDRSTLSPRAVGRSLAAGLAAMTAAEESRIAAPGPDDDVLDRLRVKRICWGCGAKTRRGHDQCAQCARRPREDEGSV